MIHCPKEEDEEDEKFLFRLILILVLACGTTLLPGPEMTFLVPVVQEYGMTSPTAMGSDQHGHSGSILGSPQVHCIILVEAVVFMEEEEEEEEEEVVVAVVVVVVVFLVPALRIGSMEIVEVQDTLDSHEGLLYSR